MQIKAVSLLPGIIAEPTLDHILWHGLMILAYGITSIFALILFFVPAAFTAIVAIIFVFKKTLVYLLLIGLIGGLASYYYEFHGFYFAMIGFFSAFASGLISFPKRQAHPTQNSNHDDEHTK